ncbi:fatty acid metabolism transcriptional regulator [Aeromonas salmonicida subsp. salmonicida A449]|uniref:Fatty acid metabolism regulator protein n=1 Tax=Aeromonas salmonicida (strain A449) TaxID=382245 RepID=A4SN79_AERS4|nr:fatty acid metabolism transcriptional regulator FadR [Aeromonas salmonicida]ABO90351.1 fatty acid metabolism transcriptional regulator [Aeromonas salmonicida subsp. salmonicida A449]
MVIKAQSPAGFAEEYIIESIWNNRFPPGSILPAERELSELIGVTRTTLREVLQRLARDGWLTIQHGKPTKVNNFWETSGLNILETLARLDQDKVPDLVAQLLSARTNICTIFIRGAIRNNPDQAAEILRGANAVDSTPEAYAEFDYRCITSSPLPPAIPSMPSSSMVSKGLYSRVGRYYFSDKQARETADAYYKTLLGLAETKNHEAVFMTVRQYGIESGKQWTRCVRICRAICVTTDC